MILLDTDVVSEAMIHRPSPGIAAATGIFLTEQGLCSNFKIRYEIKPYQSRQRPNGQNCKKYPG